MAGDDTMGVDSHSLNVGYLQVLVEYPGELDYRWHHRLLVAKGVSPWDWIAATPDMNILLVDLTKHAVRPLKRNAPLPLDLAGQMYVFERLSPDEAAFIESQTQVLAAALGFEGGNYVDGVRDAEAMTEFFEDEVFKDRVDFLCQEYKVAEPEPPSPYVSRVATAPPVWDGSSIVGCSVKGLCSIAGKWTHVVKVLDHLDWVTKLSVAFRDPSVVGVLPDTNSTFWVCGVRRRDDNSAIAVYRGALPKGTWFAGESLDLLKFYRDVGRSLIYHLSDFMKHYGFGESTVVDQQQRVFNDIARVMQSYEALDMSSLANVEW